MREKPRTLGERYVHEGWLKVKIKQLQILGRAEPYNYEIVNVGDGGGVGVLPFLDEKTVLLCRQYRPPIDSVLLELIQGGRRNSESGEEAIKREMLEETGYTGFIEPMLSIYPLPGSLDMKFEIFRAAQLRKVQEPVADCLEDAELLEYPYEKLVIEVAKGMHKDSVLVAAVLYNELRRK